MSVNKLTHADEFLGGKFMSLTSEETPFWVNPTIFEMDKASELDSQKTLRFTADAKTKRVYVWPSDAMLHVPFGVQNIKGYSPLDSPYEYTLEGTIKKIGGKYVMVASDQIEGILREETFQTDDWWKIDWHFIEQKSDIKDVKKYLKRKLPKKFESRAVNLLTVVAEFYAGNVQSLISGDDYPYWINPRSSEIEKAAKHLNDDEVRFIADRKAKKVYVWPAGGDIHWAFAMDNIKGYMRDRPDLFLFGTATKKAGKWQMDGSVQVDEIVDRKAYKKIDWSWIEKVSDIFVTDYLREEFANEGKAESLLNLMKS